MLQLSDAIALGRTTIERWIETELDGCALGMAANSIGVQRKYWAVRDAWPWLDQQSPVCPACQFKTADYLYLIGHLFDIHVCERLFNAWTLDQLVDWVRSVEPQEPEQQSAAEQVSARMEENEWDSRANTR